MTSIGVVVLHHRNWPAVTECIASVLAQGVEPATVCVVDNASGDGSPAAILRSFPGVEMLELPDNQGYAAGMNAGLARLPDETALVLLLTHDCVLAPGALASLRQAIDDDDRIGLAGPLLARHSDPDHVFSAGGTFYGPRRATGHAGAGDPVDQWLGAAAGDAAFLDGACLLARTRALCELGGFDEGYFLYFEETDLARRAQRAGWRVVCAREALAFQEPGRRPEALWVRNRLRFLRRDAGLGVALRQAAVDAGSVVRRLLSTDPRVRVSGYLRLRGLLAVVTRTSPEHLYGLGSS